MTTYPLTIWTIDDDIANGYTVYSACPRGHANGKKVDLAGLSAAGFGNRPVSRLGLKCGFCDSRLIFTVHPSPRFAQNVEKRPPACQLPSPRP